MTEAEPRYRRAAAADAPAVAAVIREVVEGPNPVVFDRPLSDEEVAAWMSRHGEAGAVWLAEAGGETAGFGALDFNTQRWDTATLGVWLRSQHRRKGIGTVLAECLLEHAREQGFRRIVGSLPENNEAALSFLSAIGALAPLINPKSRFELPL